MNHQSKAKPAVRFVDLLIFILQTHAETLKRLAAFFGEEEFLEILENSQEPSEGSNPGGHSSFTLETEWFEEGTEGNSGRNGSSAYFELEDSVRELNLPAPLEFHLWAYPFYRILIESGVELDSYVAKNHPSSPLDQLIAEATRQAQEWIRTLSIPPGVFPQAESAALNPWVRFRTRVLNKAGRKALSSI